MGNLFYKLSAIITALVGLGVAAFAVTAAYRTDDGWARVLFTLGMPASLLLPALGALLVVVGVLMFRHALRQTERPS